LLQFLPNRESLQCWAADLHARTGPLRYTHTHTHTHSPTHKYTYTQDTHSYRHTWERHRGKRVRGHALASLEKPRGSNAPPGYFLFSGSGSFPRAASAAAIATSSCQMPNIAFTSLPNSTTPRHHTQTLTKEHPCYQLLSQPDFTLQFIALLKGNHLPRAFTDYASRLLGFHSSYRYPLLSGDTDTLTSHSMPNLATVIATSSYHVLPSAYCFVLQQALLPALVTCQTSHSGDANSSNTHASRSSHMPDFICTRCLDAATSIASSSCHMTHVVTQ
jgi:hypothetical protein